MQVRAAAGTMQAKIWENLDRMGMERVEERLECAQRGWVGFHTMFNKVDGSLRLLLSGLRNRNTRTKP